MPEGARLGCQDSEAALRVHGSAQVLYNIFRSLPHIREVSIYFGAGLQAPVLRGS